MIYTWGHWWYWWLFSTVFQSYVEWPFWYFPHSWQKNRMTRRTTAFFRLSACRQPQTWGSRHVQKPWNEVVQDFDTWDILGYCKWHLGLATIGSWKRSTLQIPIVEGLTEVYWWCSKWFHRDSPSCKRAGWKLPQPICIISSDHASYWNHFLKSQSVVTSDYNGVFLTISSHPKRVTSWQAQSVVPEMIYPQEKKEKHHWFLFGGSSQLVG